VLYTAKYADGYEYYEYRKLGGTGEYGLDDKFNIPHEGTSIVNYFLWLYMS
jgi:hypothetical protein